MMISENAYQCVLLGEELGDIMNKGNDLATWVPLEYLFRRYHGEYASEFHGDVTATMSLAIRLIAYMMGHEDEEIDTLLDIDQKHFRCPCGMTHEPGDEDKQGNWDYFTQAAVRENIAIIKANHEAAKALR